jgi:hypothetical protein
MVSFCNFPLQPYYSRVRIENSDLRVTEAGGKPSTWFPPGGTRRLKQAVNRQPGFRLGGLVDPNFTRQFLFQNLFVLKNALMKIFFLFMLFFNYFCVNVRFFLKIETNRKLTFFSKKLKKSKFFIFLRFSNFFDRFLQIYGLRVPRIWI